MIKLSLMNKNNELVVERFDPKYGLKDRPMVKEAKKEVHLGARTLSFEEGDYIQLEVSKANTYVWVKFDDTFEESLIYLKDCQVWKYKIPFTEQEKRAMKDTAFSGQGRYFSARLASEDEIDAYQNLARNRHADYEFQGVYPYAHANTETRNDPTFFARNAIDGIFANDDHGSYPFQSWGINQQDDAEITIEFGRDVLVDKIALTLRCDFPHDTWWKQVTLEFSDGSEEILHTQKSDERQFFDIDKRTVSWVKMKDMIKGEDGPFPALTQIEVFGYNLKKEDER